MVGQQLICLTRNNRYTEVTVHSCGNVMTRAKCHYFMHQFGHFQSACGQTPAMAGWIFPDVQGQFQKNIFSVQESLNVLSFNSLTAGHCNLGCITKWVHTYIHTYIHTYCSTAQTLAHKGKSFNSK